MIDFNKEIAKYLERVKPEPGAPAEHHEACLIAAACEAVFSLMVIDHGKERGAFNPNVYLEAARMAAGGVIASAIFNTPKAHHDNLLGKMTIGAGQEAARNLMDAKTGQSLYQEAHHIKPKVVQ